MNHLKRGCIGLFAVVCITSACASRSGSPADISADPGATFVAHQVSGGLMIDKMEGGQAGVLKPSTTSGPQFVLYSGSTPAAAFWITGPNTLVRSAPDITAPALGQVDASWDKSAIRLMLKPEGQPTFSTSVFKRVGEGSPEALGQPASSTLDLRGVYRADVIDAAGKPAGWIQVRFSHAGSGGHRVYDAVLPATLNGPLAVAAAARLDAELSGVLRSATNPYVGN